ncbi:hypothetical protein QBC38DRAFT_447345 [Podospora fimiseda]|uniref:DUF7918 domain-containing protein n=1 Tax=Podospora fimiseda TaxID=252190 RepID=A0AAN7BHF3_9PEZI|nr:hypothetical protein QBC38DRAFT_447345 [Podospora fimiseda]
MTVIPFIPSLEVTIQVDGQDATEYLDEASFEKIPNLADYDISGQPDGFGAPPHIIRCIESKPGVPFAFVAKVFDQEKSKPPHHYGFIASIDGFDLELIHMIEFDSQVYPTYTLDCYVAGSPSKGFLHHCFTFGRLNTVTTELAEKALKGRALDFMGNYTPIPGEGPYTTRWEHVYKDPRQRPCAVFEFRYRSLGEYMCLLFISRNVANYKNNFSSSEGLYKEFILRRPVEGEQSRNPGAPSVDLALKPGETESLLSKIIPEQC